MSEVTRHYIYELTGITRSYNGRSKLGRPALSVDSLRIEAGSIIGVAGPNGGGKSTLMRLLALLEAPDSGTLLFDNRSAGPENEDLRREVTLLTQEPYLLRRSVLHNVAFGLEVRGVKDVVAPVRDALARVGLEPDSFIKRQWYELSGGEAQRVALAARLVLNPRVLLMDEPTASLDEESAQRIREAAVQLREQQGTTLCIVSHDRDWLEAVSDRIITVRKGIVTE